MNDKQPLTESPRQPRRWRSGVLYMQLFLLLVPVIALLMILLSESGAIDNNGLLVGLLVMAVLGIMSLWLAMRTFAAILKRFTVGFHKLSEGDFGVQVSVRGGRLVSELTHSFNDATQRLGTLINDLEQRLENRIQDLQLTAEISREVAGLRDLNLLLNRAINRIVERFGYYHAQVFLLDDLGEYAVLVASTGSAGKRLLSRNHKLKVGSESVIGRVTALGITVIAGDTAASEVPWRPNPDLPNTRSEMALPLKVEQRVIGALDIQSTSPEEYSEREIGVFQILADQLAIAINNVRLINELEQRVEDVARLNTRLNETAWQEFAQEQPQAVNLAYEYDLRQITPARPDSGPDDHPGYEASIEISGRRLGKVQTASPEAKALTQSDQSIIDAVAARVSMAVESARLFQQTQVALSESQRLYELARVISGSSDMDIESVYATIVEQMVYVESLDQVAILTAQPTPSYLANHLSVSYLWSREPALAAWDTGQQLNLLEQGLTEHFERSPRRHFFTRQRDDLSSDVPGRQGLQKLIDALDAETLLMVPLVTGLKWFGILVCSSRQSNAFGTGMVNFVVTAADQLAIAIEKRDLFLNVQNEARRALALAEAGRLAGELSGDLASNVTYLLKSVAGPGEFDRWWFGTVLPDGQTLQRVSSSHPDSTVQFPEQIDLRQDKSALAEAVHTEMLLLVNESDEMHPVLGTLTPAYHERYGKHLALPVMSQNQVVGALLIGRGDSMPDLDERDIQLATTLASQLAVALDNQRLFRAVESQHEMLDATLSTMPAGVLLIDPDQNVILSNDRVVTMLGEGIKSGPFAEDTYPIRQADTHQVYSPEEFPIAQALKENRTITDENVMVEQPSGYQINLLVSAAPIQDDQGQITAVVAVFQEITEIRELEKALQSSLSETTALYESSRAISAAIDTHSLIQTIHDQLQGLKPDMIFLLFREEDDPEEPARIRIAGAWPDMPADVYDLSALPLKRSLLTVPEAVFVSNTAHMANMLPTSIDANLSKTAIEAGIASFASLPMRIRGNLLGWLTIAYRDLHQFMPEERRFLTTIIDQTTIALDGVRSFETMQTALQATANLYRSSRRIAEAQGVEEALNVMQEELMKYDPDRVDLLLQRSPEDFENLYFAIRWSRENSLVNVPALPVNIDTAEAMAGFDLLTHENFWIDDLTANGEGNALHQAMRTLDTPYHAVASIPLRAGGRTVGRLGIAFMQEHSFTADDRQLITTLADGTAYIVENDLLFQQTQDSLEETGVLYQASRAIANADTRDEIVQAVVDYAASAPVDKVMLITLLSPYWDDPDALIEITTTWGSDDASGLRGLRFTPDQFPLWEQLATPEIVWVNDVARDDSLDEHIRLGCHALNINSFVVVPLRTPNRPIGAILIASSEARVHEDREIRIYQSLSDQAAIQLDNKSLYEQAEIKARQLTTSAEVSQAATSILDLDELFPRIVNLILEAFHYDHVQIFMLDDERENAVLRASTGDAGKQLLEIKHSLPVGSRSVIGQVTSTGKPVIAFDTADAEVVHRPNPFLPDTRSEMAVPLKVKGRIVGALDVQSNQARAFNNDDLQAMNTLADQLAVAIHNAELFAISEHRADELRFLFDATSAAASAIELSDALHTLGEVLLKHMNARSVAVFLYDEQRGLLDAQMHIEWEPSSDTFQVHDRELVLEIGEGITGWVIENRQPAIVHDLERDGRSAKGYLPTRSGIYIPLMAGEEVVGAIAIESERLGHFSDDSLRLLQALSTNISAIIKTAQLLEQVQRTNERLREIDELKTNFLAAMSHELRTPLNSIIGFSRVILKGIDGPINEMQEQDIQTIHDSGKHLLGLVNDILDQAKIEAGKMELAIDYFDLGTVIKSAMSSAIGLTKDKSDRVKLFTEIEDNLPDAYGDEFRTRQVLFNLISNAAKFTTEGSITVSAILTENEDDIPMIQVSVADTGIGIAETDFNKLFESFQQVDNSTTRSAEGTGLGLPLARSLAELQGGAMWLESEVGIGSTFYFTVPTAPSPVSEEAEALEELPDEWMDAEDVPESNGDTPPESKIVLVIEDELSMIQLYRRFLRGWQVIGVTKPEDAEEMAALHHPNIILLDINMPNRDGWNVLESLRGREETSHIPIIVCSINNDIERSTQLGANRHLIKPFVEADFVKAIEEVAASEKI